MKGSFDIFRRNNKVEDICPDGFPLVSDDPRRDEHIAINAYLAQVITQEEPYQWNRNPMAHETGRSILSRSPEAKVRFALALMDRMTFLSSQRNVYLYHLYDIHNQLFSSLLRFHLPFSERDLLHIVNSIKDQERINYLEWTLGPIMRPLGPVMTHIDRHVSQRGLSEDMHRSLDQLREKHLAKAEYADVRKIAQRIGIFLGYVRKTGIEPGEPWTDKMLSDLKEMDEAERAAWEALIDHALSIKTSEPSKKWLTQARSHLEAIGAEAFKEKSLSWLALAVKATGQPMTEAKSDLLKGLLWYCSVSREVDFARSICDVALAVFKKIPGIGPRSAKVGNACIYVLSQLPGLAAVAQLSRLQLKIKYSKVNTLINAALEKAAEGAGLTRADIEEIAVPTFGMKGQGVLCEDFGEYVAEIRVTGTVDAELLWIKKDGKTQKAVPAAVQQEFAGELLSLKRTIKDIESMLPAQRDRIERLLLSERSWPYQVWRERYLDHPLLAQLCRRLIWHFERNGRSGTAIQFGDRLVDAQDRQVEWKADDTVVRLWHPVGCNVSTVQEWRLWLERHGISQPFKQAHREIYLLTDAERATRTYSNRFAAHILKQHQFNALCRQRGWKYNLQGVFDSHNTPTLDLPQWNLRAEFWVEAVPADDQVSSSGIYLYVSTDQVRFTTMQGEELPLVNVPVVAFTEIMRDVDLFVSVCSVGNDPARQDQGASRMGTDYWQRYSFGDLSAQAETRKDVMSRLLPRLAIADKCTIEGKFLVIRGDLRTYKIHFGSGNVLMAPNDQYLCIVPDRSAGKGKNEKVFLPFEGDHMFSIILSKAFLLARDRHIKDETILNQIKIH